MKTKMVDHAPETPPALTDAQREHLAELAARACRLTIVCVF
jgi:hypothetical protein